MEKILDHWSESECRNILGFLGYGRPSAPIWFFGLEEGLGGKMSELDDEPRKNLHARGTWDKLMDLDQAHQQLIEKKLRIDITKRNGSSQVWLWMSRIARAYQGASDWPDTNKAIQYMRHRLGRIDGDTFMTELSPIANKKLGNLLGQTSWRDEFELQYGKEFCRPLLDDRRNELRQLLRKNEPKLVVCYGNKGKHDYSKLLGFDEWGVLADKVGKAPTANYFHLPFLGQGQMSHKILARLISNKAFKDLIEPDSAAYSHACASTGRRSPSRLRGACPRKTRGSPIARRTKGASQTPGASSALHSQVLGTEKEKGGIRKPQNAGGCRVRPGTPGEIFSVGGSFLEHSQRSGVKNLLVESVQVGSQFVHTDTGEP